MRALRLITPLAVAALSFLLAGCNAGWKTEPYAVSIGGNPQQGKQIIQAYGCGACHIIPGIRDARGLVGPPLILFSERTIIAGELPNTPANLALWIEHPRQVEPKTAMPDMGLTYDQAYDVADYLYTLR